jgi:hypothetical protein
MPKDTVSINFKEMMQMTDKELLKAIENKYIVPTRCSEKKLVGLEF